MDATAQIAPPAESPAFLRAVSQMGQRRPVVTSRAILNQQGIKLLEGGVAIDESLYDRLVAHRLDKGLDESLASEPSVNAAALREAVESAMDRLPFFGLMGPPGRVRGMLLQAIEAIPLPAPVSFHLTLARETRPELFEHSLLMAILCAHLVREGGAPIHDMTMAAAAGLLHDLGMLHIAPETFEVGKALSGDERRPLYAHPVTSSMLIGRFREYPKSVARAILEHHELMDGAGYPRGLSGDQISPLGRLLALAEVVTAMFDGNRQYPEQRVSLLLRVSPRRFDPALVPSIHRLLRALPAPKLDAAHDMTDSVGQLNALEALLAQWHDAVVQSAPQLDAAGKLVLSVVAEQADTLQRMLYEAGITPEQLQMLGDDPASDPSLTVELWTLVQELQWHLRATANQLQRRWRAQAGGQPMPEPLAAWLDNVRAPPPTL